MARQAIGADAAFKMLRDHSQYHGRKLVDVAAAIVDSHLLLLPPQQQQQLTVSHHLREKGIDVAARTSFSSEEALSIGETLGIDWASAPFDVEQLRAGMDVELEHGLHDLLTNVTDDDPITTGKIALAHLNEFPDYYTRLARMEEEARRQRGLATGRTGS
jgi:hypothetical protein